MVKNKVFLSLKLFLTFMWNSQHSVEYMRLEFRRGPGLEVDMLLSLIYILF